ncbi:MAG TPA: transcription antitermination factor NusB [Acidimicrobiales bacterium]|nr:transcription antitermination factor NusB [Acidimicrobiales bacterium]
MTAGEPPSVRGTRRQARERALSLLYEAETKGVHASEVLSELPVEPARFADDLVRGVAEHEVELDRYLNDYAHEWTVDRMPALDRALLRMSVFELLYRPDVPTGVVVSEAVDLAQDYSTEESARFVNGMLSKIAEAVRPEPVVEL